MPKQEFIDICEQYLDKNKYNIIPISEYFKVSHQAAINRGRWLGIFAW